MISNEEMMKKIQILEQKIENIESFLTGFKTFTPIDTYDELLPRAIKIALEYDRISTSTLQRTLRIGYAHAIRIIEQLERKGILKKAKGSGPREVIK